MIKKYFTLTSICIIVSMLFASCGSHFTIKKRLYTKGFYVSGGKDKSEGDLVEEEKRMVAEHSRDRSDKLSVVSNIDDSEIATVPADQKIEVISSEIPESITHADKGSQASPRTEKRFWMDSESKFQPFHISKHGFFSKSMKDTNDGLSLFWLVILIILILWAVGYFGSSIGGVINLLLLVALILLILWLLRVI